VLTGNDTIFLAEVRVGDQSERRVVVVRKTDAGFRLLAIVKTNSP
jgi:hypothetical protein